MGLSVEECRDESSEKCGDIRRAFGMGRYLNIQSDGLIVITVLDYEGSLCARDTLRPGVSFYLVLVPTVWWRYYYCPHFAGEQTEALCSVNCVYLPSMVATSSV